MVDGRMVSDDVSWGEGLSCVPLVEAELDLFGFVVEGAACHEVCFNEYLFHVRWNAEILNLSSYGGAVFPPWRLWSGSHVTPALEADVP